ncbi:MAG: DUF456 domain-containing protein [Calditrichaeota bacterium]|nr:MAG: DUF456 domain-containing protein [Calditrichota bacterium]
METVTSFALHILFWLILVGSIIIVPIGLPGTFIIAGMVLLHGFLTDFVPFNISLIVMLFGIAAIGEVVEFFFGAASTKKFGGSKNAMWGAVIGGFGGAIIGSGVVPIIGTLVGAFAGAFLGAALMEYGTKRDVHLAFKVGFGAFLGALGGRFTKLILALVMVIITAYKFF